MNNAVFKLAVFLLLASGFIACKEDPTLRDQLIGQWQSSKVVVVENGVALEIRDSLSYNLNLYESLNYKLGTLAIISGDSIPLRDTIQGDWIVNENNRFLTLSDYNGTPVKTWQVTGISDTQMTFEAFWEKNTQRLYQISFNRQ